MNANHHDDLVTRLYHDLLDAWNRRDGDAFAALFEDEGTLIGFDGSQMNGKTTIAGHLNAIFADHVTAPYTGIVKDVRFLAPDVALLRAIVGMIPIGQSDFDPQLNAL